METNISRLGISKVENLKSNGQRNRHQGLQGHVGFRVKEYIAGCSEEMVAKE